MMSSKCPEGLYMERDTATEEITYEQGGLALNDVTDIIDRLHIGTLRREELKAARQSRELGEAVNPEGEPHKKEMDDRELEEFYRSYGAHAEKLQRQSSKASSISMGSTNSGDSEPSQAPSTNKHTEPSRRSKTQEMGIQTTLGKSSSSRHSSELGEQSDSEETRKSARKSNTKDKVKRLFGRESSSASTDADEIHLPILPKGFVVKYMGKRSTKGLWGSKHTRSAVEEIVDRIGKMPKGEDLPLVNLDVYYEGLAMRPHTKNRVRNFKPVQIPIQFISYGLQDTVYPRIFCFIMVKEMSAQAKSMECHVYACDSAENARDLATCLAIAFQAYSEKLDGGAFRFSVDLKMTPDDDDTPVPNSYDV